MGSITVEIRNVYGNETIYPICERAIIFARLAGTRTLTRAAIQAIKALGYRIDVKQSAPATL